MFCTVLLSAVAPMYYQSFSRAMSHVRLCFIFQCSQKPLLWHQQLTQVQQCLKCLQSNSLHRKKVIVLYRYEIWEQFEHGTQSTRRVKDVTTALKHYHRENTEETISHFMYHLSPYNNLTKLQFHKKSRGIKDVWHSAMKTNAFLSVTWRK